MRADINEVSQTMEHLAKLSSQFYELIPMAEQKDEVVAPIANPHQLQNLYQKMDQLVNVEFSSRVLLGALHRQYEMHPIEYIYNSLGVKITPMREGDPECDLVRAYCLNTANSPEYPAQQTFKRLRVYKVERRGEPERFAEVAERLGNRKLLFHGSGMSNWLGLLAQGMRIAPPEAPVTGYMFGKGCYFADMM